MCDSLPNVSKTMTRLLPFLLSPGGWCGSLNSKCLKPGPNLQDHFRTPLKERGGKGATGALSFSHFLGGGRAGWERAWVNSLRGPACSGSRGGITRSSREERYSVRKGPAAAQRCRQGAQGAGPPPGLEAGGPSQAACAARPHCQIPYPHSHLVTSQPSRRAPEVCGAGAERSEAVSAAAEPGPGAWRAGRGVRGRESWPTGRSAREREGRRGAVRRRKPAGGPAQLLCPFSGASAAAAWELRLGWPSRPRGTGECEGGGGAGVRACGRSFQRERAGKTGWRLLNRNVAFIFWRDGGPLPHREGSSTPCRGRRHPGSTRPPSALFFFFP